MNRLLLDPQTWDDIAALITTERDYHYDSSDQSHMIDMAQIVCTALNKLNKEQQ
jgi:hypothetical protein